MISLVCVLNTVRKRGGNKQNLLFINKQTTVQGGLYHSNEHSYLEIPTLLLFMNIIHIDTNLSVYSPNNLHFPSDDVERCNIELFFAFVKLPLTQVCNSLMENNSTVIERIRL
jgi:hypothetical protein